MKPNKFDYMNTTTKILTMLSAAALVFTSCLKEPEVAVHASFTTDKEVYELNEDIKLTNTSYAENAKVVACKWEWGQEHTWGIQFEGPISFSTVGEHEVTLTATSDIGNVSNTFVKVITVQDTNTQPVADFTYSPTEGIKAGDTVKFTDKSSDPDGSIVAWEWVFGTTVMTDQNPEFTFVEYGDIKVSLTVTDNMKKKHTKEVVINVGKSAYSLELLWEQVYETNAEAWIKFTSPAVSPDGSMVYAFSTGMNLTAFTKDGQKQWTFDAAKHNPNPYCSDGSRKGNSCTPSVDEDGTVYLAVAYNEKDYKNTVGINESGVYAVNPDGSEKWYHPYGNARYIAVIPVILGDYLILTTKYNPEKANYPELWETYGNQNNGQVINKKTGAFASMLQVKQGNYGGTVGFKDGRFITHCNEKYGSRVFFPNGEGKWKWYGTDDNFKALGWYNGTLETGDSSQMATDKDGKVYILYTNKTKRVSGTSILYCYDINKYVKDGETEYAPEWVAGINGKMARYNGLGVVLGEDGTVYVTTGKQSDNELGRVTAVNPDGTVKWESIADGDIAGSAAVDNEGYIYYNDYKTGKLIKLEPTEGKKVSEMQLADDMRSSPAISPDGTIYCVGMKGGLPTLFAVQGSATGHANSWSQLGGNPSKTCVQY